jgi:hypothetical protein
VRKADDYAAYYLGRERWTEYELHDELGSGDGWSTPAWASVPE